MFSAVVFRSFLGPNPTLLLYLSFNNPTLPNCFSLWHSPWKVQLTEWSVMCWRSVLSSLSSFHTLGSSQCAWKAIQKQGKKLKVTNLNKVLPCTSSSSIHPCGGKPTLRTSLALLRRLQAPYKKPVRPESKEEARIAAIAGDRTMGVPLLTVIMQVGEQLQLP